MATDFEDHVARARRRRTEPDTPTGATCSEHPFRDRPNRMQPRTDRQTVAGRTGWQGDRGGGVSVSARVRKTSRKMFRAARECRWRRRDVTTERIDQTVDDYTRYAHQRRLSCVRTYARRALGATRCCDCCRAAAPPLVQRTPPPVPFNRYARRNVTGWATRVQLQTVLHYNRIKTHDVIVIIIIINVVAGFTVCETRGEIRSVDRRPRRKLLYYIKIK